jgi:hypothetical protein
MLNAAAWPYPVCGSVECRVKGARFGSVPLEIAETAKGYIISGPQLRGRSRGMISLELEITTSLDTVLQTVFGCDKAPRVQCGARVLCQESKFRAFSPAGTNQVVTFEIPLENLRGVAEIDPLFICDESGTASNGIVIEDGAIVGFANKPIFIAVDEDWTGETIPVDWLDFRAKELPAEAFLHVELSGGSQVPKVWLNAKYKNQLQPVLARKGDASPAALADAALRELIWSQVWPTVVVWAFKEESSENSEWPSSRIAKFWRNKFEDIGFDLTVSDPLEIDELNEIALRVQHCLRTAQNLSRINEIFRFQPDRAS